MNLFNTNCILTQSVFQYQVFQIIEFVCVCVNANFFADLNQKLSESHSFCSMAICTYLGLKNIIHHKHLLKDAIIDHLFLNCQVKSLEMWFMSNKACIYKPKLGQRGFGSEVTWIP